MEVMMVKQVRVISLSAVAVAVLLGTGCSDNIVNDSLDSAVDNETSESYLENADSSGIDDSLNNYDSSKVYLTNSSIDSLAVQACLDFPYNVSSYEELDEVVGLNFFHSRLWESAERNEIRAIMKQKIAVYLGDSTYTDSTYTDSTYTDSTYTDSSAYYLTNEAVDSLAVQACIDYPYNVKNYKQLSVVVDLNFFHSRLWGLYEKEEIRGLMRDKIAAYIENSNSDSTSYLTNDAIDSMAVQACLDFPYSVGSYEQLDEIMNMSFFYERQWKLSESDNVREIMRQKIARYEYNMGFEAFTEDQIRAIAAEVCLFHDITGDEIEVVVNFEYLLSKRWAENLITSLKTEVGMMIRGYLGKYYR